MFFEDEKDFIDSNSELQIDEDGTVTWEDVLSSADEDELVSLSDDAPKQKSASSQQVPADGGFSDELQLIEDDEVDENELNKILKKEEPELAPAIQPQQVTHQTEDAAIEEDDFDIDKALESAVNSQKNVKPNDTPVKPRKTVTKSSSSSMPILIVILFLLIAGGGVYFLMNYMQDKNVNQDELSMPITTQDQMNNMSKEDLEQRALDNQEDELIDENSGVDIPVIDESETGDLQAQEEQKEEKKQVVSVVPTGRPNPFVPLQKYMTVSIPQTKVNYDKVDIPKPPQAYAEKDEALTKLMSISVSGIMYDDVKPSAIITFADNDYFVQKGDKLDDYKIVDIQKNSVTVASGKNLYKANIGEEFKIDNFYGNAGYISPKQGGGRQYYTASEDDYNLKNKNKSGTSLRYVSESDVNIIAK